MTKEEFFAQLNEIDPADVKAMEKAADRQARLAKPPGSLGVLEELSIKMAGITGQVKNTIEKTCVAVMCADNGVAEEGIASAPVGDPGADHQLHPQTHRRGSTGRKLRK